MCLEKGRLEQSTNSTPFPRIEEAKHFFVRRSLLDWRPSKYNSLQVVIHTLLSVCLFAFILSSYFFSVYPYLWHSYIPICDLLGRFLLESMLQTNFRVTYPCHVETAPLLVKTCHVTSKMQSECFILALL